MEMDWAKDRYLLGAILLALAYTWIVEGLVGGFQQLPSPLFGGDYYYQLGGIYHDYESGPADWFKSGNMLGQLPGYLPLYPILVTAFGKLLGLAPLQAMLQFNMLLPLAAMLSCYFLFREWLASQELAFVGAAALVTYTMFPVLKYTEFTSYIVVPFFLWALLRFFREQNNHRSLLLGAAYLAMGLAHGTSFIYASFMVIGVLAYLAWRNPGSPIERIKPLLKPAALSFGLGFLLAQIIWFVPIFTYHGSPPLKNHIWATVDVARFNVGFDLFIGQMRAMFFNTADPFSFVIGLLSLGGLILLLTQWRKREEPEFRFLKLAFLMTFVFVYSYFVLSPLLDTHFVPTYSQHMYLAKIVLAGGLFFLRERVWPGGLRMAVLAVLAVAYIWSGFAAYEGWNNGQWTKLGRLPLSQTVGEAYVSLQQYLLARTSVNDVVLSNNELSFAINGLSGRKVMVSRRSQNDPFMDFDQRQLDAAIIYYGKDTARKMQLLRQYQVKYVYFDPLWFSMEYVFDNEGQIRGYSDPLMLLYSPEKERALQDNGIRYARVHGYIDPAMRGDEFRTYDLLVVTPDNYDNTGKGAWKDDLDPWLEPVWGFESGGRTVAVLYRLNGTG